MTGDVKSLGEETFAVPTAGWNRRMLDKQCSPNFHPRLCTPALSWRGCRNRRTLDEPFGDFAP
jgi:hypothetical protein